MQVTPFTSLFPRDLPLRSTLLLASSALCFAVAAPAQQRGDLARWQRRAQGVTIMRDDWGIAHVYGKTDADAVFGMEYAQAEDDFNRIETNYLNSLGRLAEAEGEPAIYQALRQRLFIDPDSLRAEYRASPPWLRHLMDAFADGLNYFLYKHPEAKPRVITHFEPWMALSFTEGSIGGDIERINPRDLQALYGSGPGTRNGDADEFELDPTGSNGIAIAPRLTANHHALLWINPHTSLYFRSELQMVSDEGLNAYGAVTWGQFFIYQGFNATAGWMHTSSGVDNIDEFLETQGKRSRAITVPFKTDSGMARKTFTVSFTQHGPVIRKEGDRLVSISLMKHHVTALIQSYSRTKARDMSAFRQIMERHTNSSNNTVFADASGNIAYFHSNYIPRRDTSFDWTKPVDGSNPATTYRGVLSFDETPNVVNPASGWVYNSNNWPWSAAGEGSSPRRADYPRYVETGTEETPRGYHALRVLSGKTGWAMSSLTAAAFDSYLPAFERMIPPLIAAYDQLPATDTLKTKLAEPIAALRTWDFRWGPNPCRRRSRSFGVSVCVAPARRICWARWRPRSTRSRGTSARGRRRGARSTAFSGSTTTSRRISTTRSPASRCRLPRAYGAPWRRSAPAPIPTPRSGTARAATASSQSSSSATASARRRSRRAAKAAIPTRRISTTRPRATPPAGCVTSISTAPSSPDTPSASTTPDVSRAPRIPNHRGLLHGRDTMRAARIRATRGRARVSRQTGRHPLAGHPKGGQPFWGELRAHDGVRLSRRRLRPRRPQADDR